MINQETMASQKGFSMMVRMKPVPSLSTVWTNTRCVAVGMSLWTEIRLLRQLVAGPAESMPLFYESYRFQEILVDLEPEMLTLAPEAAKFLGVMSKLELHTWGETHPAAVQGTLSSSGLWKIGVILASSISIKCSFQIKRKEGGKKKKKGWLPAEKLPSPLMEKWNAKCAKCVFLSSLKEKAKPQLPMFNKWPTKTYKDSSAFLPPGKVFFN